MKRALFCFVSIIAANIVLSIILSSVISSTNFWVTSACNVGLYLVYLAVYLVWRKFTGREDFSFRLKARNIPFLLLIAFICIACFMLVQFAFIDLFANVGPKGNGNLTINGWGQFFMCVFAMCLLPAVIEELLFRGVVFKSLKVHGQIIAIVISALLFAVYHLSLSQFIYQFILGLIFASVYNATGNLFYSMILHFINNFFVVAYTFITGSDFLTYSWNAYTVITAILLAILGGIAIITLVKGLSGDDHAKQKRR